MTLMEFAAHLGTVDLAAVAGYEAELGSRPYCSPLVSEVLAVPTEDLLLAMRSQNRSAGLTPLQRGAMANLLTRAGAALGHAPLKLGVAGPAEGPGHSASKRKLSAVIDQALDGEFQAPEEGDVRTLFRSFDVANGGQPLPAEEPTGDQLQALQELLGADRSPYADFALWGPFGRRQQKLMKYNAMVWVGGQLETRLLSGPPSFGAWRKCWRVFRTAMVLLRGSRAGALDAYEERIRTFAELYPEHWGTIARADDILRSEGWERIRRDIQEKRSRGVYQGHWNEDMPWEAVIRDSAMASEYWQENLRDLAGPARPPAPRPPEGAAWAQGAPVAPPGNPAGGRGTSSRPGGLGQTSAKDTRKKKRGRDGAAFGGDRRADNRHIRADGKEICFAWNRSAAGCAEGTCPSGRAHVCEWCLGPHRAVDPACTRKPPGWQPAKGAKKKEGA